MNDAEYLLFVTCPKGLQYALENELQRLGAQALKPTPAGAECRADKSTLYKILLWSRIANRVVLQLYSQKVNDVEDVYDAASAINWSEHFSLGSSFAVDFQGTNRFINNSTFGALKVKDAIVDMFREQTQERPVIDRTSPDIRVSARLQKGVLTLGLDLSGESLHKRGYRVATGKAPLKENLAAGLLELCGWPHRYEQNASFIDPMCGSGTLLIEAGMSLCRKAPGLDREKWGFDAWLKHDGRLWSALIEDAKTTFSEVKSSIQSRIVGFDEDSHVVHRAWQNIQNAGLEDVIHVEKRPLNSFTVFERLNPGLLLSNPPYGERLGEVKALEQLYKQIGQTFEQHLLGWQAAIFTGNAALGKHVGWRSHKQYKLFNGAIESVLLLFDLKAENRFKDEWRSVEDKLKDPSYWKVSNPERAQMFSNRLKKNSKKYAKWIKKSQISCYRLYDADMPEFSLAVDLYCSEESVQWLHVQEYVAPKSVDEASALERLREALAVLRDELGIAESNIVLKRRRVQKGTQQYEKEGEQSQTFNVLEHQTRLTVNLRDYLDTGLFLDHRPMRRWVQENAKGKKVLNLFCYTGSVTAHAVVGGAAQTLSVDMSRTYLDWAEDNLKLNKLDSKKHRFVQADCLKWLENAPQQELFDLIFLDPPSFSNSKRMEGVLDVQRDHVSMIEACMSLLNRDGTLVFSNNLKKFKLEASLQARFKVQDVQALSIDPDFERNPSIHHCWHIQHV